MSDIPFFLPQYSPSTMEWLVCRLSTPDTVTPVLYLPNKIAAMTVCQCLNSVRSELLQNAILSSLTHCKKNTPTRLASSQKSRSKRSSTKAR